MGHKIVIAGMGPIGCASVCMIKALNKDVEVAAFDHHPLTEKRRNHGLNVRPDSVKEIREVLKEALLNPNSLTDIPSVKKLDRIFANWSGNFVRTTKIEDDLSALASEMGIEIVRDRECKITPKNFDILLDPTLDEARQTSTKLQEMFENATIIIGADGAKSTVRTVAIGDKLADQETLRYLIELKYQTDGQVQPRSNFEASKEAVSTGQLSFESMSKDTNNTTKPVTLHVFVEKLVFDKLRVVDAKGDLKGVFGNSWTLKDIEEFAKTDLTIHKVHKHFRRHLESIEERGGRCLDAQISTLEMNIYRSTQCVTQYRGKLVLLVGDSESGIILEGGFNKGLRGVAALTRTMEIFLSRDLTSLQKPPEELRDYTKRMQTIFNEERRFATLKNAGLSVVEKSLSSSRHISDSSSEFATVSFENVAETSESFIGGIFSLLGLASSVSTR